MDTIFIKMKIKILNKLMNKFLPQQEFQKINLILNKIQIFKL